MKVGVMPAKELKKKSDALGIPFADLLWGYLLEDFLRRVYESEFKDVLMLAGEGAVGIENYAKSNKERLEFYYLESLKKIPAQKQAPGQKLSGELLDALAKRLFTADPDEDIEWTVECRKLEACYEWELTGSYFEMQAPLCVRFFPVSGKNLYSRRHGIVPFMEGQRVFELLVYAPENRLSQYFYEIMKKLELIADMEAYAAVNEILKNEPVSGRHILEELQELCGKEPAMLKEKRMDQIAGYRDYVYMRKRWEQYQRTQGGGKEPWSDVVDRFLAFAGPIWRALCKNEIFFDDWMPGLGRYLS